MINLILPKPLTRLIPFLSKSSQQNNTSSNQETTKTVNRCVHLELSNIGSGQKTLTSVATSLTSQAQKQNQKNIKR